jgi:hypothetical protein
MRATLPRFGIDVYLFAGGTGFCRTRRQDRGAPDAHWLTGHWCPKMRDKPGGWVLGRKTWTRQLHVAP